MPLRILYSVNHLHNTFTDQTPLTVTVTLAAIMAVVTLWLLAFKLHYVVSVLLASSHTHWYQQAKFCDYLSDYQASSAEGLHH